MIQPRYTVRPFVAEDIFAMRLQPAQVDDFPADRALLPYVRGLEQAGKSFTICHDGCVLVCYGIVSSHAECATAWGAFSEDTGPHMLRITRIAHHFFKGLSPRRIDLGVRASFAKGQRFARMCGFTHESIKRCWFPNGEDMHEFALIRGGQ